MSVYQRSHSIWNSRKLFYRFTYSGFNWKFPDLVFFLTEENMRAQAHPIRIRHAIFPSLFNSNISCIANMWLSKLWKLSLFQILKLISELSQNRTEKQIMLFNWRFSANTCKGLKLYYSKWLNNQQNSCSLPPGTC